MTGMVPPKPPKHCQTSTFEDEVPKPGWYPPNPPTLLKRRKRNWNPDKQFGQRHGRSFPAKGQTAIHWAIRGGHGKLAIQVAEDARTNIEATTQLGFNPLMRAAQSFHKSHPLNNDRFGLIDKSFFNQ
eukprot:4621692-Amphidinium_carterae.1